MQIAFAMPTKVPPKYCVVFVKMKLKFNLFASVRYTMNFVRNTSTGINLQTENSFTLLMQCRETLYVSYKECVPVVLLEVLSTIIAVDVGSGAV